MDSLIAYQAAMIQRPVVAPVPVGTALKPFARRDLLLSQADRVASVQRSGGVNPIVGGIAQSLIEWQQRARQGLQEGIAAAEAEEAAASAIDDADNGDGLDWSHFDSIAAGTRSRPSSAAGGRRARSPAAGRLRSPGRAGPISLEAEQAPSALLRPPSAYDRYLLRRRQEVVEGQNEADIARALESWRESKTAVDAEIERRIQARRRPQSGGLWAHQLASPLGQTAGGLGAAASLQLPPPTPRARNQTSGGGGGAEDEEGVILLRGVPSPLPSASMPPLSGRGELAAVPEGSPLQELPKLPFAAARSLRATTPFVVTSGSQERGGGASALNTQRPSMMQWWGSQVRAQSALAASRSASNSSLGQIGADRGGSGGGVDGAATDGRPWSAWTTTRAVLPPRTSTMPGSAPSSSGDGSAALTGTMPPSGVRPAASGRLQALMSATQRPRTAADIGELNVGTSGVDVLLNASAIRYHVYDESRREFEQIQGIWDEANYGHADAGAPSAGSGGDETERRGSIPGFRSPLQLLPAMSMEAAARVYMPSLACVSLEAAKQEFDAIPQTRVQPFAGTADAAAPGKGGKAAAKPAAKPAAKTAGKAPGGARPSSAAPGLRKPGAPAYSVTVGPRQWSAGGAASSFCFAENPLLLEKRLQTIRDDALGLGKKKKKGGAKKKK